MVRALRESDNTRVILKVLRELTPKPESIARLRREAEIVRLLQHSEMFGSYQYLQIDNLHALVMDDFNGQPLNQHLGKRSPSLLQILRIIRQTAQLLGLLHSQQIVHQNICPQNILWDPVTHQVRLIDFGLASPMLQQSHLDIWEEFWLEDELIYIAPEQITRSGHEIDARSDFYSLGATFYHIACRKPPFLFSEVQDLLHQHLTSDPEPPYVHDDNIPPLLSALILKLLNKEPESRYQSASGLIHDLDQCYHMLSNNAYIEDFKLGCADNLPQLRLSQKLVGRDKELELLEQALNNVSEGKNAWVFLSGPSGIGKSALVQKLHPFVVEHRGFFVRGSADKQTCNSPYSPLVGAFKHLIRLLLLEPTHKLKVLRSRLNEELYPNGSVLLQFMPEWEAIIGSQETLPILNMEVNHKRVRLVISQLIKVLSGSGLPLVLFLDNMEWTDLSTLELLQSLYEDEMLEHTMFVVAYREGVMQDDHPLFTLQERWDNEEHEYLHCSLRPLTHSQIHSYLRLSLKGEFTDDLKQLADECYRKTAGNPFFLREFLQHIFDQGWLTFDGQEKRWIWEIDSIHEADISDDVLSYHLDSIRSLPQEQLELLELCSCVGFQFDPRLILSTYPGTWESLRDEVAGLCREGLLVLSPHFALEHVDWSLSQSLSDLLEQPPMRFVHTHMQQALYEEMDADVRSQHHYALGTYLFQLMDGRSDTAYLFEVAHHLNQGAHHAKPAELEDIARLNLRAGKMAKQKGAFVSALNYYRNALETFGQRWSDAFELTFELHQEAIEVAYFCKEYEVAERYSLAAIDHSKTQVEKLAIQEIKVLALLGQHRIAEALDVGLSALREFGIHYSKQPNAMEMIRSGFRISTARNLLGSGEWINHIPSMTSPLHLAVMRLMGTLLSASFTYSPNLMILLVLKMLEYSRKHGRSPLTGFALATCGMMFSYTGRPKYGSRLASHAFHAAALLSAGDKKVSCSKDENRSKILLVQASFLKPWEDSFSECLPLLKEGYQAGVSSGDFEYASYNLCVYALFSYLSQQTLPAAESEVSWAIEKMQPLEQPLAIEPTRHYLQLIRILRGRGDSDSLLHPKVLSNSHGPEEDLTDQHKNNLFTLQVHQLFLFALLERWEPLQHCNQQATRFLHAAQGSPEFALFYYYRAVAFALKPKSNLKDLRQSRRYLKEACKRLKTWAKHAPSNYQSKWLLCQALLAASYRSVSKGQRLFGKAIQSARDFHAPLELGLAKKAFGLFMLEMGNPVMGAYFLEKAFLSWEQWGAKQLCEHMVVKYGEYLDIPAQVSTADSETPLSVTPQVPKLSFVDWGTFLQLSQTVAKEVGQAELLRTVLLRFMQHLKAHRGVMLCHRLQGWFLEGESSSFEGEVEYNSLGVSLSSLVLESNNDYFCADIVRSVIQRQAPILVHDARQSRSWGNHPYIQKNNVFSLLCVPLVARRGPIGVLYYENRYHVVDDVQYKPDEFLPSQLEMLDLLSPQIAESIYSDRAYADLRDRLEEQKSMFRKQYESLHQTQTQLAHTARMSSLGILAGGVAHEIRNPLNFSLPAAHVAQKRVLRLQDEVLAAADGDKETEEFFNKRFSTILGSIDTTLQGLDRIKSIVEEFLIFSQLNEVESKVTPIGDYLHFSVQMVRAHYGDDVNLSLRISANPAINCFPAELNQAFLNVMLNAFEAVHLRQADEDEDWEGKVCVQTKLVDGHLAILFQDNGVGISEEDLPYVFDPFFKADKGHEHSGLGLSTAHGILQRHKGTIEILSEPGAGTEVKLLLPLHPVTTLEAGAQ